MLAGWAAAALVRLRRRDHAHVGRLLSDLYDYAVASSVVQYQNDVTPSVMTGALRFEPLPGEPTRVPVVTSKIGGPGVTVRELRGGSGGGLVFGLG